MKKLLVVSAIAVLGLTSAVFAGGLPEEMPAAPAAVGSDSGIYVGIAGGYDNTNWSNVSGTAFDDDISSSVSKDTGAIGRIFVGYDFNKYFAAELGYAYFFNKARVVSVDSSGEEDVTTTTDLKTQVVDLFGKIKAPITDEFGLYAKVGMNYLMVKPSTDKNLKTFNVAFGAGADYAITPNVIANVEWLRYNGSQKLNTSYVPNTDAFMIGLRYKFDL